MRRGAAWIVVVVITLVLIASAYMLQGELRPSAGVTPTPTKTPRLAMNAEPSQEGTSEEEATPIAQPAQTTPTDIPPLPTPVSSEPTVTLVLPTEPPDTPTPESTPFAIPAGDFNVNIRSGPGVDFPRIGRLSVDGSIAVVGRTASGEWWQVCCVDGESGWVWADVVEVRGPLEDVPVPLTVPQGASPATAAPTSAAPTATRPPPAPSPTSAPVFAFVVEGTQAFDNTNAFVNIFAKIYKPGDAPVALSGYRMRVLKNGGEVAVLNSTTEMRDSAPPGWGNAVKYNVEKFEAPLDNATWTAYVIDGSGKQVSPEATFHTSGDSLKREFYVGFALK